MSFLAAHDPRPLAGSYPTGLKPIALHLGLGGQALEIAVFESAAAPTRRNRHKGAAAQARRLEERLADLKARKSRLIDAVADQLRRKDEARERLDAVEAEAALVQRELGEAREEELDLELVLGSRSASSRRPRGSGAMPATPTRSGCEVPSSPQGSRFRRRDLQPAQPA